MKNLLILFFSLTFSFITVTAQITFTEPIVSAFYAPGATITSNEDTIITTVNIGAPGGNNEWDFSILNSHVVVINTGIDPNSSPFISSFPTTTHVFVSPDTQPNGTVVDMYTHLQFSPDAFKTLGTVMQYVYQTFPFKTTISFDPSEKNLSFPLTYGTEWTNVCTKTLKNEMGGTTVYSSTEYHTTHYKVDAYGTIKKPGGEILPAIRIKEDDTYTTSDKKSTNRTISYDFITHSGFTVSFDIADINAPDNGNIEVDDFFWTTINLVDVEEEAYTPTEFNLYQNYPNPFNPTTTITYQLPTAGNVSLKVFDVLGKEVAVLVDEYKNSGKYSVNFDAGNLSSGVYIYTIKSGDLISSKKLMLMK